MKLSKHFTQTLILAAAGALLVFSSGCVAKARRPVPSDTDIIGATVSTDTSSSSLNGSGYSTTTTTTSNSSGSTYNNGGSAGSYGAGTFGNTSVFTPPASTVSTVSTTTTQSDVLSTRAEDGTRDGDKIRNISSLQPIYFDFDRYAIKSSEFGKIQALKDYLAKNPTQKALIEGNCDWRGTAEYNMALGDRRANAVKRYAISIGIPANKIQTVSLGSTQATENGTDAQMSKDRRGEIVILVK